PATDALDRRRGGRDLLTLARKHYAVANAQKAGVDARIVADLHVERAQRLCVRGRIRWVRDRATPEHVVDRDHSATPQQLEARFVVRVVARLVRVDEREVESIRTAVIDELAQ